MIRKTKRNRTGHPLYSIWTNMKRRCYDARREAYKTYGARGITICDEWKNDYRIFFDWAINNGWYPGLTIDRKDVNGNYEPSNCRWVTKSVNSKENKQKSLLITYNGETHNIREWGRILNIPYSNLYFRVFVHNMPIERAFSKISLSPFREYTNGCEMKFAWSKSETIELSEVKKSFTEENNEILPLKVATIKFEYNYIKRAMILCDENKSEAAKVLGLDRKTLYNKISQFEQLCV